MAFAIVLLGAPACDTGGISQDAARRPNVVIYVVDTLRADSLGIYGNPAVRTEAIDRVAREGVLFENAYAHSAWTRPSITSILTGLYPDSHGVESRDSVASEALELLPEVFADHGYATAALVANPNVGSFFGFDQGFDDYRELYSRRTTGLVQPSELTTRSDGVTAQALEFVRDAPQPFFLFVLTIDPHWPYEPPTEFDRYRGHYRGPMDRVGGTTRSLALSPADRSRVRSLYDGEVTFNDDSFGRIVDLLRTQGLLDDTILVFTSDHGEEFWDHGGRFHAKTLFEEILRVPLLIRYPRALEQGLVVSQPVESVDIFPTMLRLASLPGPDAIDGRDLFESAEDERPGAYASVELGDTHLKALLMPPWKMIWNPETGLRALYNLEIDPREQAPLDAARHPAGNDLSARLNARAETNAASRVARYRGVETRRASDLDLPPESRSALEALGYIEGDDTPGNE